LNAWITSRAYCGATVEAAARAIGFDDAPMLRRLRARGG